MSHRIGQPDQGVSSTRGSGAHQALPRGRPGSKQGFQQAPRQCQVLLGMLNSASLTNATAGAACARKKDSEASNAHLRKGKYGRARDSGSTLLTRTLSGTGSLISLYWSTGDNDATIGKVVKTLL